MIPAAHAETTTGPIITTYSIPIMFYVNATDQVPAAVNGTAGTVNMSISLPYTPSASADVSLYYKLVNASSGAVLSSASNVNIKLLDANGNTISTVLLSSSPGEAVIPLSGTITQNLTVVLENSNTVALNATIEIIVVDSVQFNFSLDQQKLELKPGQQGTVKVTITQTSGPSGTLFLSATSSGPFTMSVNPSQTATSGAGSTKYAYWYITVKDSAKSGTYTATLKGTFVPERIPGHLSQEFTIAEITFPLVIGAASGASGFALGSLAGAQFGWWAVAVAIIILIVIVAVAVRFVAG